MKSRFLVLFLFLASLLACDDNQSGNSIVNIKLTDAPSDYDAVNVDVKGIEIHYSAESDDKWLALENVNKGVYNLLDFSNGKDTLLVSSELPSGKISQIRLILGSNNSIVTGGNTYQLEVPSGSTSGLKINLNESVEEAIVMNIWLDFDANKSIVKTGNGKYQLKPVIRAYTESISGAIKGK